MVTTRRPKGLADYEQPPIDEVAIAAQFKELSEFTPIHHGYLFDRFKKRFPKFEVHPPIQTRVETFGRSVQKDVPSFQLVHSPPSPRLWFISDDGHRLVQFQPNRLISNWRKVSGVGDYPHFESILPEFFDHMKVLKSFVSKQKIGAIEINQCELSYFNNIDKNEDESFVDAFCRVFRHWKFNTDFGSGGGYNLERENCNFAISSTFYMKGSDEPSGRLHIEAVPATKTDADKDVIRLNLVVRGRPTDTTQAGLKKFYLAAREAIVKGFDSITTDECHEMWKRKAGGR